MYRWTLYTSNKDDADAGLSEVGLDDLVEVTLTLTIAGQPYVVWGANVKELDLHLFRYGLSGRLRFFMMNDSEFAGKAIDKLFAPFSGTEPIHVTLGLKVHRPDDERLNDQIKPFVIHGLVDDRYVNERPFRKTTTPKAIAREYVITFRDPAALYWRQHHPCALYTTTTLKAIIDRHKGDAIRLQYDSQVLAQSRPLVFLGLFPGQRSHASFYDWLIWLCDSSNLLFTYHYKDQNYRIADEPEPLPKPTLLGRKDLERILIHYPKVPRYTPRVLNSYTEAPRTQSQTVTAALPLLWNDHLLRTQIAQEFEERGKLETNRRRLPGTELAIDFCRLPSYLFGPGDSVDLTVAKNWQMVNLTLPALARAGKLRVMDVNLRLRASDPELSLQEVGKFTHYTGRMRALLTLGVKRSPRLPAYVTPRYPHTVEAKIVSEQGTLDEETYDIKRDVRTKLRGYRVKIPVFANQQVTAPFLPTTLSGHFYFPLYKNQRVLVALDLFAASITGMLDWRPGAEVPLESQGNQLYMGKKLGSSVILSMVYEDGKPCFKLQRFSNPDRQTVLMKEGVLSVFVGENTDGSAAPGKKTIRVTLEKAGGATMTIENPSAQITQVLKADGTQVSVEVRDAKDTSSYTQVADTITIRAKNVNIHSETLKLTSEKASSWMSQDTLSVHSKMDMTFTTDAKLGQTAMKDAMLNGDHVKVTAKQAALLAGKDTTVSGLSTGTLTAPSTTVQGRTSVAVLGSSIEVKADASLSCESSGTSTLKGGLTSIEGSLIKVG